MKEGKKKALKKLKEDMKCKRTEGLKGKMEPVQKVSVTADSKEGLEKGLSMAEKLLKKREAFKNGGKKKEDRYVLPDDIKKQADKLLGKHEEEEEMKDDSEYSVPEELKSQLKNITEKAGKTEGASKLSDMFKKRKKR